MPKIFIPVCCNYLACGGHGENSIIKDNERIKILSTINFKKPQCHIVPGTMTFLCLEKSLRKRNYRQNKKPPGAHSPIVETAIYQPAVSCMHVYDVQL